MILRLEFTSTVPMVDLAQVVGEHAARAAGLDEDSVHWVGLAVRESVLNAIAHGNDNDTTKAVFVEFETTLDNGDLCLTICVRDQGGGFDPESIADPLAPENLLKPGGRGIFLIRSFMDDVRLERVPEGGMEVRMTKRVRAAGAIKPTRA
jgi:serine/threonine-protein kinase RsbW